MVVSPGGPAITAWSRDSALVLSALSPTGLSSGRRPAEAPSTAGRAALRAREGVGGGGGGEVGAADLARQVAVQVVQQVIDIGGFGHRLRFAAAPQRVGG